MNFSKPHVSPALRSLMRSVAFASTVVVACALVQMLVFGFVHFTEVRWLAPRVETVDQPLTVVPTDRRAPEATAKVRTIGADGLGGRPTITAAELRAVGDVRAPSRWEGVLRQFSSLAGSVGAIAALVLALVTFLGVVIAGGAAVPGLEKTVTASVWAIVVGLVCLPWEDLMPSLPLPGVFAGYEGMVAASEAVNLGKGSGLSLISTYLLMPVMAVGCALVVAWHFRGGVEAGVVITAVSELDEAVDREMAAIRARGVGSNVGPRSVGALNQAIGDTPALDQLAASAGLSVGPTPEAGRPRGWVSASDRRLNEANPGQMLKRPI